MSMGPTASNRVRPKRRFVTDNRDYCFVGTNLIRLGSASLCPGVQARIQFQLVRVRLHYDGSASIDRRVTMLPSERNVEIHLVPLDRRRA